MLTVLCGPPGSGKSTWAAANAGDAVVLTADAFRRNRNQPMMNQLYGIMLLAPDHLRQGKHVIIDATSAKADQRRVWLETARRANVPTRLILFTTPLDVCLERNAKRGRQAVPPHIVRQHHTLIANANLDAEGWGQVITV